MLTRDVAKKYNVYKSMTKKNYSNYNENNVKNTLFRKYRRGGDKHNALFNRFYDKFSEARRKDLKVNFRLYVRANQIHLQKARMLKDCPNQ